MRKDLTAPLYDGTNEISPALRKLGRRIKAELQKFDRQYKLLDELVKQARALCSQGGFEAFCASLNVKRSRGFQLLAVGEGRKTFEEIRAEGAERAKRFYDKRKRAADRPLLTDHTEVVSDPNTQPREVTVVDVAVIERPREITHVEVIEREGEYLPLPSPLAGIAEAFTAIGEAKRGSDKAALDDAVRALRRACDDFLGKSATAPVATDNEPATIANGKDHAPTCVSCSQPCERTVTIDGTDYVLCSACDYNYRLFLKRKKRDEQKAHDERKVH